MLLVLRASKYFEKRGLRKKKSKVILQNPKVPVLYCSIKNQKKKKTFLH